MGYTIKDMTSGIWMLDEKSSVNLYVVVGTKKAALLDTGFYGDGLQDALKEITDLPVILIHTHAHGDHIGADAMWDKAYAHESEFGMIKGRLGEEAVALEAVREGDLFDLGGRTLEAIHTPGHSPGSICYVDSETGFLFSGDTIMDRPIFLHFPNCSASDLRDSLEKLEKRKSEFSAILPSHNKTPLTLDYITEIKESAQKAVDGTEPMEDLSAEMGFMVVTGKGYKTGKGAVMTVTIPQFPDPQGPPPRPARD